MADITPVLRGRWSPRAFSPVTQVTQQQVDLLLEAARWAPSARNRQPWRFILARRGDSTWARVTPSVRGQSDWALEAGLLVVALYEPRESSLGLDLALYDLGGAVADVTVQAEAMGLHVHQFATFDHAALEAEFDVAPPMRSVTILAVGTPAVGATRPARSRLDSDTLEWARG